MNALASLQMAYQFCQVAAEAARQVQGSYFCCTAVCPAPAVHAPCASVRVQSRLLLLTLSLGIPALPLNLVCTKP